jgi:hypothetical protein
MQGPAWISLLRRIPAAQHDSLLLMTTNGTEIVVQRIMRLEGDFLVMLGRLSGSTDEAKCLVLPYDQLTYLAFNKKLTDTEMDKVLAPVAAGGQASALAAPVVAPAKEAASTEEKPGAEVSDSAQAATTPAAADTPSPATNVTQPAAKPNPKGSMPSRSVLLARLRQRLTDEAGKPPKP